MLFAGALHFRSDTLCYRSVFVGSGIFKVRPHGTFYSFEYADGFNLCSPETLPNVRGPLSRRYVRGVGPLWLYC